MGGSWLGKVAAGILGLAGATSCLLQVRAHAFQVTSTNILNTGLFHNCQYGVKVRFVLIEVSSFMQQLLPSGGKASL